MLDMRRTDQEDDFRFRAVARPSGQESIQCCRRLAPMHRRCEVFQSHGRQRTQILFRLGVCLRGFLRRSKKLLKDRHFFRATFSWVSAGSV